MSTQDQPAEPKTGEDSEAGLTLTTTQQNNTPQVADGADDGPTVQVNQATMNNLLRSMTQLHRNLNNLRRDLLGDILQRLQQGTWVTQFHGPVDAERGPLNRRHTQHRAESNRGSEIVAEREPCIREDGRQDFLKAHADQANQHQADGLGLPVASTSSQTDVHEDNPQRSDHNTDGQNPSNNLETELEGTSTGTTAETPLLKPIAPDPQQSPTRTVEPEQPSLAPSQSGNENLEQEPVQLTGVQTEPHNAHHPEVAPNAPSQPQSQPQSSSSSSSSSAQRPPKPTEVLPGGQIWKWDPEWGWYEALPEKNSVFRDSYEDVVTKARESATQPGPSVRQTRSARQASTVSAGGQDGGYNRRGSRQGSVDSTSGKPARKGKGKDLQPIQEDPDAESRPSGAEKKGKRKLNVGTTDFIEKPVLKKPKRDEDDDRFGRMGAGMPQQ